MTPDRTVLFIHGIGEIGGAERELLIYTEHLPSAGYVPMVVCPDGGPFRAELHRRGISTLGAAFPPWRKLAGIWKRFPSIWALRALLEEVKPALVHVNEFWWVPQTLRALSPRLRDRTPVVAHFRQDLPVEKVRQYELVHVDEVCAVSEAVATTLRTGGVPAERVHVVHSGLGGEWFTGSASQARAAARRRLHLSDEALVFVTVANLFERKGYHVAFHALAEIVRNHRPVTYFVVGEGDEAYERQLRQLTTALALADTIQFVGFQSDIRVYLDAADVYLQPALMEGFGIAVLEAMACGCAVVASRTGGIPDMVVEGETGVLVPPGQVEDLARAITCLAGDAQRRRAMGEAGRRRAMAHFSVERMMTQVTEVYRVAGERRAATEGVRR